MFEDISDSEAYVQPLGVSAVVVLGRAAVDETSNSIRARSCT
jgi:hypothetical protein